MTDSSRARSESTRPRSGSSWPPASGPDSEAARGLFLVDDPLFDEHRSSGYHPERPERLAAARRAVTACEEGGLRVVRLAPRDASEEELATVHGAAYVEALTSMKGARAAIDDDTYVGPRSVEAALRAAGGGLALVDALLARPPAASPGAEAEPPLQPRLGLALVRPPGHHARPDRGMGFCLVNNVAAAARHALARGLSRVAILDWDVHHGNGTQEAFWRDPHVFFASLHQWPMYPGTGAAAEVGDGEGRGTTLNVPLSRGATDAVYAAAIHEVVAPALARFEPELVLVSAGFDAHARDPLADMALSAEAFRSMAAAVRTIALATAGGRVGLFLEGGYDLAALEASLGAALEGLLGVPAAESPAPPTRDAVDPTHAAEIDLARAFAEKAPPR